MNPWKKAALVAGTALVQTLMLSTAAFAGRHDHGDRDDDGDRRHKARYSDWGPVVSLGCTVNSAADEFGPAISKNGRSLYFGSNRVVPEASGGIDLYVAQRASKRAAWGEARNLGPVVNSTGTDNIPSLTRDGHWMFFNSNRSGSVEGSIDMWVSYRARVHDDFAWETPFNLGPGVNTPGFDAGAIYFENRKHGRPLLFFGSGSAQATSDIWVAELQRDGTFGNKELVAELNTPQADQRPMVRSDGLEVIFFSNRPGSTLGPTGVPSSDLWVATRKSVNESWEAPVNLGPVVNTAANEMNPYLSPDGRTLFFASNRGECGGNDLYMTTRTRLKHGKHHRDHHDDDDDDDD
jgi:Tol biopolymer transport system component